MRVKAVRSAKVAPHLSDQEIAAVRATVIFEDEHIIAFDKPSGLSSQGGRGQVHTLDELLWAFARSNGNRPRLVHRLDRDTSGIILTARTKPAAAFLGKAMMARRFRKTYLALTSPAPRSFGRIELPLRRDESGPEAWMRVCDPSHPDAETALTIIDLLSSGGEAALVRARPNTGRMHQIRVHLQALGAPLLGDARYGGRLAVAGEPVPRLMLHAAELSFPHPAGGERTLRRSPPEDFRALATRLGIDLPADQ